MANCLASLWKNAHSSGHPLFDFVTMMACLSLNIVFYMCMSQISSYGINLVWNLRPIESMNMINYTCNRLINHDTRGPSCLGTHDYLEGLEG